MDKYMELNKEQREAVFHTDGPLLLLAGAGSGKTKVLTHRIAYLIEEKGVRPWNIMAITFTNKAAKEMRERIDRLIGEGAKDIWVSTFHSSCVRILRRYADAVGFDRTFSIYDTDDTKKLIKDILKEMNIDSKMLSESFCANLISSAKNQKMTPPEMAKEVRGDFRREMAVRVYENYQKKLHENNAMDFDDLLMITVELFQANPDILEIYQEKFRYIMVDEYQDTNGVQFELVSLLAGKYKNLCVVGDDDQSIYAFRGADIRNILNFEEVYPQAKVIRLEQNYRSTKNILAAANSVIANNQSRKAKALWTENTMGNKLKYKRAANEKEEARFVTAEIEKGKKAGKEYSDFAVLYRTNAQSRSVEEALVKANIPYTLIGGVAFYQRKEIKDMIAYLRVINNPKDTVSFLRIINEPRRGIGEKSLEALQKIALQNGISLLEAAGECRTAGFRGAAAIYEFYQMMQYLSLKLTEDMALDEWIKLVLEKTKYTSELMKEGTPESLGRVENINELVSKAKDYTNQTAEPSLNGFLEDVALVASVDTLEEDAKKVVLMTIHSAKGLEFPVVFMIGMEENLFPSYMSLSSGIEKDVEEERRLAYVGITRAKQELFLTTAKERLMYGKTQVNPKSRFLKEIPEDYIEELVPEREKSSLFEVETKAGRDFGRSKVAMNRKPYAAGNKMEIPSPQGKTLDYAEGDMVKHMKFGIGKVISIEAGGADFQVKVLFPGHGEKMLMASFAKLKRVE
ncbi:DNA helicase PcrA [Clostridiales bacterium COT073_COT-073]|nr:DNA helicase PcrA [Clostridiales bacterium COT073_COT-073]